MKQPEASYTDENGIHYRLADWEVRELPEASRSRMLEKTEVYREVERSRDASTYVDSSRRKWRKDIRTAVYAGESGTGGGVERGFSGACDILFLWSR